MSAYRCLLNLNSGNVIQSGFSYGSFQYEIQTKLWGEGMSTGELLREMKADLEDMIEVLSLNSGDLAYGAMTSFGTLTLGLGHLDSTLRSLSGLSEFSQIYQEYTLERYYG